MEGFGQRLVEVREKRGFTQKRLAELLDITPTRLNYWEKDKREPDFYMFSKILSVLKVSADDLLGLDMDDISESKKITPFVHEDEGVKLYMYLDSTDKEKTCDFMGYLLSAEKYKAHGGAINSGQRNYKTLSVASGGQVMADEITPEQAKTVAEILANRSQKKDDN